MPAPDPQTTAPRSGLVPHCAKCGQLLALSLFLFSACLNPMPEEFPSNGDDGAVIVVVPGSSADEESSERPTVPDQNSGPGDLLEGESGSGGSGDNATPPATTPTGADDGDGEADAPDAGADAGAPAAATGTDDTSPEGDTTP